jgi:hypothetical protein
MHESGATEIRENLIQELLRNVVGLGDLRDLGNFLLAKPGKMQHRLQTILAFVREHSTAILPQVQRSKAGRSMNRITEGNYCLARIDHKINRVDSLSAVLGVSCNAGPVFSSAAELRELFCQGALPAVVSLGLIAGQIT